MIYKFRTGLNLTVVIKQATYIFMKRVQLSLAILLCCLSSKAQFQSIDIRDQTGLSVEALFLGDNTSPTSCTAPFITTRYTLPTVGFMHLIPAGSTWFSLPSPAPNNFVLIHFEYMTGSGYAHTDLYMCGMTSGIYPLVFTGSSATMNAMVNVAGPNIQIDLQP
ncbi:MAG: hypothetical protein WC716_09845 [Chitinophagaceae bacterium]|jgi:hypothetical protein